MRFLLPCLLLITVVPYVTKAQAGTHFKEVKAFQNQLNEAFKNPKESPLTKTDLEHFDSLDFYKIDTSYRVTAYIKLTPHSVPFEMATTTERKPKYRQFGILHFVLKDTNCTLSVYQNLRLKADTNYSNYLFLPFKDFTNGTETYGGGRFIDLKITDSDSILIDFNKAYNPYCAYNHKYSCPIPPPENTLPLFVKAGVKNFATNH